MGIAALMMAAVWEIIKRAWIRVRGCHDVRARGSGGTVRIDLHITVDPQMTVTESHELAERVERQIRAQVGGVAEVLIHAGAATLHR
jgi:divalent metal cation (Fe/Co/Zn/Cd) transporter